MSERVSIHIDNHIAEVRLNRPEKMNALDQPMFEAIIAAQSELAKSQGLRAVVLSGEGKSFCAGLDLQAMTGQSSTEQSGAALGANLEVRTHGNANIFQEVAIGWRKLAVPVVTAIHGVCFGGGLQIASGGDIRVVTADARLSIMEMKWGLIPDMAGFALWRGYVRDDVLRELTYTNREFSGTEAQSLGFATYVDDSPHERAMAIAKQIAAKNPDAIKLAKHLFNQLPDLNCEAILLAESEEQKKIMRSANQIEAVMSTMQKRPPQFSD